MRKNVDFQVIGCDDEVGWFEFVEVENDSGPLLCPLNRMGIVIHVLEASCNACNCIRKEVNDHLKASLTFSFRTKVSELN